MQQHQLVLRTLRGLDVCLRIPKPVSEAVPAEEELDAWQTVYILEKSLKHFSPNAPEKQVCLHAQMHFSLLG